MEFSDQPPLGKMAQLKEWVHGHPRKTLIIVGAVLVSLALGGAAYAWMATTPSALDDTPIAVKPKPKYYSPLTGSLVKSETATTKPVTAIMIENSPDARPQSGLKQAEVVYEAIAEGGITRFLALYQQNKPKLIGPVRSVRLYYVDWLAPYNASVVHVGGSARALALVRGGNYRDLDQFFNPSYYWRASDRYAPHNVYTNFKKLDALNKAKGYKTSNPKKMLRDDVAKPKKLTAKSVSINISSDSYNPRYVYSKKTGLYKRYLGGVKHNDREKGQITAKVVVAMRVNMKSVFEDGYRESIDTISSGKATVFQNGTAYNVKWQKVRRGAQIKFTTKSGKTFALARGTTWISAVPNDGGSVSWR